MSSWFNLNGLDLAKGAITAILAAILVVLVGLVGQQNFDVFQADWVAIFHSAVNYAFVAFVSYLAKNLLTDSSGSFLGMTRNTN